MKKKYLKKMLSIMLAAMTVSATPGLVGAMKEESKKAIQEVNSKIANNTLTEEAATNMLDELEEMAKEDDEAKKEVSWTLTKMIDRGLFARRVKIFDYLRERPVSTIKPPSEETIAQIIRILQRCLNCDATKRNVAKSIQTIAEKKWLKKEHVKNAIENLTKCLKYDNNKTEPENYSETKEHVAKAIDAILKIEEILYKLTIYDDSEIVQQIMQLLKDCFQYNETTVASAISSLIEATSFTDHLDPNEILNMLDKSLEKYDRSKVYVAKSINGMIKGNFFKGNLEQNRILNMLQACSESFHAQKYVADALLPSHNPENLCDKNSFDQCLTMLETCAKNNDARLNVAGTICSMTFHDLINKNSCDKILNILHECSKNSNATELAISAIRRMKKQGLLNEKPMDKTMLDIIELCSKEKETICVINDIVEKDLLNQYQSDEVKRIVDSFDSCIDNHPYIKNDSNLRVNICQTIATMAMKNILNKCPKHQVELLVMRLIKIFNQYGTPEAIGAISAMNEKNLINQVDSYFLQLLIDSLIHRFDGDETAIFPTIANIMGNDNVINQLRPDQIMSIATIIDDNDVLNQLNPAKLERLANALINNLEDNNTREATITMLSAITQNNNILDQLTPDQLNQLANSLPGDLANNNTQEAATIIISAMARNPQTFNQFNHDQLRQILNLFRMHLENYLADGNYEMADRIFEVLKRCSKIDALKADVVNIIESLIQQSKNFYQYLNLDSEKPILGNFLDILICCSKTQDAETQKKAMFAILAVIHNMNTLINTIIEIPDKIPQIIEMLEELSKTDQVKIYVADAIRLLGERNLLNNLTQADGNRLVNAMDNCLTYAEERISAMTQLDENRQDIAIAVRKIFEDQPWTESFIQHLSPGNAARFIDLAHDSKTAADKVGDGVYQSFQ